MASSEIAARDNDRVLWKARAVSVAESVAEAVRSTGATDDDVLLIFIARGGLLLMPAFLDCFPTAKLAVLQISRTAGLTYAMALPAKLPRYVILVDAVVASGGSLAGALKHLGDLSASTVWVASLSATRASKVALPDVEAWHHYLEDDLIEGVPTLDLSGRDAGDVFQGFEARDDNRAEVFARAAHDAPEEGRRRDMIHHHVLVASAGCDTTRILDVGCGDGRLTEKLGDLSAVVVGYDPHLPQSLSVTDGRAVYTDSRLRAEAAAPFTLINCCMVLNAIPEPAELLRWVRPLAAGNGGQLWTMIHPAFGFNESMNAARRAIEDGSKSICADLEGGYIAHGQFAKLRGGQTFVQFHRPLGWYITLFRAHGFEMTELIEPNPSDGAAVCLPRICIFRTRVGPDPYSSS